MEQLIVTIKNGKVEIEVKGARGTRCLGLTQAIEKLIGKIEDRLLKDDCFREASIDQNIHLKQFSKSTLLKY